MEDPEINSGEYLILLGIYDPSEYSYMPPVGVHCKYDELVSMIWVTGLSGDLVPFDPENNDEQTTRIFFNYMATLPVNEPFLGPTDQGGIYSAAIGPIAGYSKIRNRAMLKAILEHKKWTENNTEEE